MTEGICTSMPVMPASLRWPISHEPGMLMCDRTGLLGAEGGGPSPGSADGEAGVLSPRGRGSNAGLAPAEAEPLPDSISSITHSWEPDCGGGIGLTATNPPLAAPSSGSGVAAPVCSSSQGPVRSAGPSAGPDLSPSWDRTGRALPRLEAQGKEVRAGTLRRRYCPVFTD